MQILNRDADSSKLGKRKRRKRIHDMAQKSRDMGQRGEKGRETGRHKVRKWDGITGWEGKETMEGEVGMEGAVGQEAGKKERARTSEWTWDGLIIWSNLLLCQRVWRRRCQFLSCLLDSHHLWSHFEQVSSVLRKSVWFCFPTLEYKFWSADLFSQGSSKVCTSKKEQRVLGISVLAVIVQTMVEKSFLTLKSCQDVSYLFFKRVG